MKAKRGALVLTPAQAHGAITPSTDQLGRPRRMTRTTQAANAFGPPGVSRRDREIVVSETDGGADATSLQVVATPMQLLDMAYGAVGSQLHQMHRRGLSGEVLDPKEGILLNSYIDSVTKLMRVQLMVERAEEFEDDGLDIDEVRKRVATELKRLGAGDAKKKRKEKRDDDGDAGDPGPETG